MKTELQKIFKKEREEKLYNNINDGVGLSMCEYQTVNNYGFNKSKKEDHSSWYINRDKDLLIAAYFTYEETIKSKNKEHLVEYLKLLSEYNKKIELFNNKKCKCGSDLKWVEGYNFFGCSNYRTGEKSDHISFNIYSDGSPYLFEPIRQYSYCKHIWCTEILKILGLHGKIQASKLFNWYMDNDFPDLRIVHSSEDREITDIDGWKKTKERSNNQEKIAENWIKNYFKDIYIQQDIIYKFENEDFTRRCVLDFVLFNNQRIIVADCKLDYYDDLIFVMDLYTTLIKKIHIHDKRNIEGVFFINESSIRHGKIKYKVVEIPGTKHLNLNR